MVTFLEESSWKLGGKRLFQLWVSCGQALFPLIVRQLAQIRPIKPHCEEIRVRLIAARQHPFVLPSHSAAGKDVPFSVSRPRSMRVITPVVSETLNSSAVGPDRVDFEVAVAKASKCNQVPFWRPSWKIIITGCELRDLSILDIHNPKALFRPRYAVHEALSIGRPARQCGITLVANDRAEAAPIGFNDGDLRRSGMVGESGFGAECNGRAVG